MDWWALVAHAVFILSSLADGLIAKALARRAPYSPIPHGGIGQSGCDLASLCEMLGSPSKSSAALTPHYPQQHRGLLVCAFAWHRVCLHSRASSETTSSLWAMLLGYYFSSSSAIAVSLEIPGTEVGSTVTYVACLKVLTVMNDSPFYLPGYWRGEALRTDVLLQPSCRCSQKLFKRVPN
eukprot:6463638-Amphidinium_carterae.1